MDLSSFGIGEGGIYEVIVSTYHEDGRPNSAPMGLTGSGGDEVLLRVHKDTDTYANIMREGCCVINLVYDPYLFLVCALRGRKKGSDEIEWENVSMAKSVKAPYLLDAVAVLEAELLNVDEEVQEDGLGRAMVSKMVLRVKRMEVFSKASPAPCRGFYAALELAIDLSRGRRMNVKRLIGIINKTLPPEEASRIENFVKGLLV